MTATRKQKKTAAPKPTKQRIINLTVTRLRRLARELAEYHTPGLNGAAVDLERWATALDLGADGRETQERRNRKRATR